MPELKNRASRMAIAAQPVSESGGMNELMAKLLAQQAAQQPTYIQPGDPPAKAWAPVINQLGSLLAGKRAASEQSAKQSRMAELLSGMVQGKEVTAPGPMVEGPTPEAGMGPGAPVQGPDVTSRVPYSEQEKMQMAAQIPELQGLVAQNLFAAPQAKWEQMEGPRGSLLGRNTATGETKQIVGPERESDWMMPGYVAAQRAIAEAKNEGKALSPTAQKELFEADESIQSASNVIGLLERAKELNSSAMSGPFAASRAKVSSWMPGEDEKANKTIDLDNIMTGQALESLKLVFGGMPTEGERKILLEMQASVDKTPAQRAAILDRAVELAQRRSQFNKSKAESLRSGSYFKDGPKTSEPSIGGKNAAPKPSNIDDLLKKY